MCIMGASAATWVATPEIFPTEMRATGHSICNLAARLGGFAAPYFVQSSFSVLSVAFGLAAFNILGSGASYLLPETGSECSCSYYLLVHF